MQPNTLWVPERIATALVAKVLETGCTLPYSAKAVAKAALSSPSERPTAMQHYESITVQESYVT